MAGEVKITLDKFHIASEAVGKGLKNGLVAVGFAVQEQGAQNIQENEQIDTSAMRSGLYLETKDFNQRESVVAQALSHAATVGVHSGHPQENPQTAMPSAPVEDEYTVKVGECMEYGIVQEMGAVGSAYGDLPPRPYLKPAAEKVKGKAKTAVGQYIHDELNKVV